MGHEWGTMPGWLTTDSTPLGEWRQCVVAVWAIRRRSGCHEAVELWRSGGGSERPWLGRGGDPIACRFRSAWETMDFVPRRLRQQSGRLGWGFGRLAEASRSRSRGRRGPAGGPGLPVDLRGAQSAELENVFLARLLPSWASLEAARSTSSSAAYGQGSRRRGRRIHDGRAPPVTPGPQ